MDTPLWSNTVDSARQLKDIGLVVMVQILGLLAVLTAVVGVPIGFWYIFIRRPMPGTLVKQGEFECEDPAEEGDMNSRKRDFARIVAGRRDLWVFTPNDTKAHAMLPMDVDLDDGWEAVTQCYEDFKAWLKGELSQIPGATWESGRCLGWAVIDRVVNIVSVSPEFQFLQRFKIQPRVMQPKWLIMISKTGQVRVAWYAFVTDSDAPGQRSGPFVVKLVSEDLNQDRAHSWCTFQYTCLRTRKKKMQEIIAAQSQRILDAVSSDAWKQYCVDY